MAQTKSFDWKYWLKLVIGLFLMFASQYVFPTWAGVTPVGVAAVGIFAGVVFLISTGFGLLFPAILGMFAMQLTGFYTSGSIISASFGGNVIYQLIIVYALCAALQACGASDVMARWFITRKFAEGKPMLFTFMFMLGAVFVGALVGLGGIVFYYSVLESICKQLGYAEDSKWYKVMVLGTYTNACVGMSIIPFKSLPLIIFGTLESIMASLGFPVNYSIYMLCSIIVGLIFAIVFTLIIRYVWKADMSKLVNLKVENIIAEGGEVKMNKQQIICSVGFVISILYSVLQIFITKGTPFGDWYNGISQGIWFGVVFAALCIIRVDGKPVVNGPKVLKDGVDWPVIFAVAVFSLVGSMISSNDLGIKTWLNDILSAIFGGMAFPVFMLILIALTTIITNFFSNTAIGVIMSTLAAPFIAEYATNSGVNPSICGCAIVLASMFAFLTMAASGSAPLLLGHAAVKGDNKLVWGNGLFTAIIFIIMTWIICTLLAVIL